MRKTTSDALQIVKVEGRFFSICTETLILHGSKKLRQVQKPEVCDATKGKNCTAVRLQKTNPGMAKNLLIVESPAKAKTIEKILGSDFEVKSCYGHIRDLEKNGMGIDIAY